MRLIDVDAMLKRNEYSIYDTTDLKEMLDNEPTVEFDKLEEIVYAKWYNDLVNGELEYKELIKD